MFKNITYKYQKTLPKSGLLISHIVANSHYKTKAMICSLLNMIFERIKPPII